MKRLSTRQPQPAVPPQHRRPRPARQRNPVRRHRTSLRLAQLRPKQLESRGRLRQQDLPRHRRLHTRISQRLLPRSPRKSRVRCSGRTTRAGARGAQGTGRRYRPGHRGVSGSRWSLGWRPVAARPAEQHRRGGAGGRCRRRDRRRHSMGHHPLRLATHTAQAFWYANATVWGSLAGLMAWSGTDRTTPS